MIELHVKVPVYPTEDDGKVLTALKNVFDVDEVDVEKQPGKTVIRLPGDEDIHYDVECTILSLDAGGAHSLMRMHELLRKFYIVETARSVFFRSLRKLDEVRSRISFSLNKQAALAGKLHFSGRNESPLGSMDVVIDGDDLEGLINWLAPPTKDGVVLEPDGRDTPI